MVNIRLLFVILDEGFDKKINIIFNRFGIKTKTVSMASGTASPSLLDYFGLVESKKNIFMAIVPDYLIEKIFSRLKVYFSLDKVGTGIAFTVPISGSNKFLTDIFNKNKQERNILKMNENFKFCLIITVVLNGYVENVMNVTKKAGCFGGTVLKGRDLEGIIPIKMLGFNIDSEREIILNVVPEKNKIKVMEEITKIVGIKTEAKGYCLSIPVIDVLGFERDMLN